MLQVHDISFKRIAESVEPALAAYAEPTDDALLFDLDEATKFRLTPERPNSARSISTVHYLGAPVGQLFVIAFAPEDCTGDEGTFKLRDIEVDPDKYPVVPGIVPRSKAAMYTEVHIPIASFHPEQATTDPVLFAGSLGLLGLDETMKLHKIADLGHPHTAFDRFMSGEREAKRSVTATTGYIDPRRMDGLSSPQPLNSELPRRFGDPHAVINRTNKLQIAGFLGLSPQSAQTENFGVFRALQAHAPYKLLKQLSS